MTGPSRNGGEPLPAPFERILIVKPSSLGDIVHALPVLHGLRTRYPAARIDWLINAPFAPLLADHPEIDELVLFDRRRYGRLIRSPAVTKAFLGFVRELRGRRYDLVVDLQGLFRTGFLSWASGAAVRVGFREAREGAWVFYSHRMPPLSADAHAVDRNYCMAGLLGFADVPIAFRLALAAREVEDIRSWLREAGLHAGERLIAIAPGARWQTKVWPAERFAETIDALQASGGMRCALIGSTGEVDLCHRIAATCESAPINLAGRTNVRRLAALVAAADCILCHDSAAVHLAAALNRPLVCLTGPTNPRRTGPYRRMEDVVRLELDCAPCYLRHLSRCRHHHRCMQDLDVTTVVSRVRRALGPISVRGDKVTSV